MKTKVLNIFLLGMFAIAMMYCSTDDENTTESHLKETSLDIQDYYFMGKTPEVVTKKGNHVVTKTIKFYESEGPFEFDFGSEGCGPAPYLTITGTGIASHLGMYNVVNKGCYDGISPILGVITAADGDEVHTYIADAEQDPDNDLWTYHYKIYDGTGKFEGAYGDIYLVGTIDFENWWWKLSGEGRITY